MTTATELPRYVRLRNWMAEHGITDKALGEKLGTSGTAANKLIRNDTMPTKRHQECLALGFPSDLLPHPYDGGGSRAKAVPFFPGLASAEQSA